MSGLEIAEQIWDFRKQSKLLLHRAHIDYGINVLRSAALTNAGALAACISIFSNDLAKWQGAIWLVAWFGLGLILAMVASGLAYLTITFYRQEEAGGQMIDDSPYYVDGPDARFYRGVATKLEIATMLLIVGAYICTSIGGFLAIQSIA